jgi:hypothetical protein
MTIVGGGGGLPCNGNGHCNQLLIARSATKCMTLTHDQLITYYILQARKTGPIFSVSQVSDLSWFPHKALSAELWFV